MKFRNIIKIGRFSVDKVDSEKHYKFPSYNEKENSKRGNKAVKEIKMIMNHKQEDCYDLAYFEELKYNFEPTFDQYSAGDEVKSCHSDSEIYCNGFPHFEVKCSVIKLENISKKMREHLYHCRNLCTKSCTLYNHKQTPSIYPTLL